MKKQLVIALALLTTTIGVNAETYKGELNVGSLDSELGSATFITNSPIGKKIFAVCQSGDMCEIQATADKNGNLINVQSVKKTGALTPNNAQPTPTTSQNIISNAEILKTIKANKGNEKKISTAFASKAMKVLITFEARPNEPQPIIYSKEMVYFYCSNKLIGPGKKITNLSGEFKSYDTSEGNGDPQIHLTGCKLD